jgi:hypothetical protein
VKPRRWWRVGASVVALGFTAWPGRPVLAQQPLGDLDALMARVLERRDDTWRKLHDYILSETETFSIDGPGGLPLNGFRREYAWYVRDGFLIRSPLRFDGVAISEEDRRTYEANWLKEEEQREAKAKAKATPEAGAEAKPAAAQPSDTTPVQPSIEQFVTQRGEPRFVSESFFLRFKFEPGNYYFSGRERVDGRDTLRIEYYPTNLFGDEKARRAGGDEKGRASGQEAKTSKPPTSAKDGNKKAAEAAEDAEIERKMNKVALVTLWVDPSENQIVKYTFDNVEFDFLPGRWLVRVDDITASMTMARVLDGVWLPSRITVRAGLTFANGAYAFRYGRDFYDYKKAEVGARIRIRGTEARQP